MSPPGRLRVAAVLAACAVAAFGPPATRSAEAAPSRLTIAFTGDVGGYLEPCG